VTSNLQILYEYGIDNKPHSSGVIRLLRPFSYSVIEAKLVSRPMRAFNPDFGSNWVIVDRLWHPHDVTLSQAESLVKEIHESGSRLIYAIDDNLLDLPREKFSFQEYHFQIVELFLRKCDGILVTTPYLKQRFSGYQKPVYVLQNALDERLLLPISNPGQPRKGIIKIGYMGTVTHKSDIEMILPALKSISIRHPNVRYEFIGGIAPDGASPLLSELPISWVSPGKGQNSYPLFMLWFTSHACWDIALAPLENSPFTRAKSDIKLLDYASIGAAAIFSRCEAYQSSVLHQETGWLTENTIEGWEDGLETLITKEELRIEIAKQAYRYLYRERTLKVCASKWIEAIQFFDRAVAAH
jgi:glycosyltransferase involved in cell wall biosynthesis